jgi:hypothetical protein
MTDTSESGSRYLSLALSARSVMASLRPVANGAPVAPELDRSLHELLKELQWGTEGSYVNHLGTSGSIPSFEEVSTFVDITRQFGAQNLRMAFETLLGDGATREQDKSAWQLIEFFGAVESQALDQYASCLQARMG